MADRQEGSEVFPGLENFKQDIKLLKNGRKDENTRDRVQGTMGEILVWVAEKDPVSRDHCEKKREEVVQNVETTKHYPLSILIPVWLSTAVVALTGIGLGAKAIGLI